MKTIDELFREAQDEALLPVACNHDFRPVPPHGYFRCRFCNCVPMPPYEDKSRACECGEILYTQLMLCVSCGRPFTLLKSERDDGRFTLWNILQRNRDYEVLESENESLIRLNKEGVNIIERQRELLETQRQEIEMLITHHNSTCSCGNIF